MSRILIAIAAILFFSTGVLATVGANSGGVCDDCKMTIERLSLIDTFECPEADCDDDSMTEGPDACEWKQTDTVGGKFNAWCVCNVEGTRERDECPCQETVTFDEDDQLVSVWCSRNRCASDCKDNTTAGSGPGLHFVCECP